MDWKAKQPLTPEMRFAMHRFFFSHYAAWYRNGGFAKAIASIPQVNMLDDHDLIDGFGAQSFSSFRSSKVLSQSPRSLLTKSAFVSVQALTLTSS